MYTQAAVVNEIRNHEFERQQGRAYEKAQKEKLRVKYNLYDNHKFLISKNNQREHYKQIYYV